MCVKYENSSAKFRNFVASLPSHWTTRAKAEERHVAVLLEPGERYAQLEMILPRESDQSRQRKHLWQNRF